MKKIVLVFGLIAGLIMVCLQWIIYTLCLQGYITFDNSTVVGYAGMLIAFSMIFFGIKSYRDSRGKGSVTFWKAVQIGLLITLTASVIHAAGWHVHNALNPDFKEFFLQKYTEFKSSSLSDPADGEAIAAISQEVDMLRTIYDNPLLDFVVSMFMMLPLGIIVTLVSAALLRKKDLLPAVHNEN